MEQLQQPIRWLRDPPIFYMKGLLRRPFKHPRLPFVPAPGQGRYAHASRRQAGALRSLDRRFTAGSSPPCRKGPKPALPAGPTSKTNLAGLHPTSVYSDVGGCKPNRNGTSQRPAPGMMAGLDRCGSPCKGLPMGIVLRGQLRGQGSEATALDSKKSSKRGSFIGLCR